MSSFSVFDFKGGEICRTKSKPDHNNLQVVMIREREDSGLWISLCNGENLLKDQKARLKSIMPHGDICKGKISFKRCLHVVPFTFRCGIFNCYILVLQVVPF